MLIGGVFQAFVGAVISGLGASSGATNASGVGSLIGILGIIGIIFGLIMIVGGVMMYSKPTSHTMWGVIVLILSIVSFATSSIGGFVLGFILGLIGGILGIAFKPSMMPPGGMGSMPMGSQPMGSTSSMSSMGAGIKCPACGAMAPAGSTKCPNCGAML